MKSQSVAQSNTARPCATIEAVTVSIDDAHDRIILNLHDDKDAVVANAFMSLSGASMLIAQIAARMERMV